MRTAAAMLTAGIVGVLSALTIWGAWLMLT